MNSTAKDVIKPVLQKIGVDTRKDSLGGKEDKEKEQENVKEAKIEEKEMKPIELVEDDIK